MPAKLSHLKCQPLLEPPRREPLPEWLLLSGADMELIRKGMEASRHPIDGPVCVPLAEMHFFLKELGVSQGVPEEDREIILGDFGLLRRGVWNNVFAQLHFLARRLGLVDRLEEGDREKMASGLDFWRKERTWYEVAALHHHMHGLGVGSEVTKADREGMMGFLEEERKSEGPGRLLGLTLWHMKALGLSPEATRRDRAKLKSTLEWFRQVKDGSAVLEMHYVNRLIRDEADAREAAVMPPLKRFGR